MKRTLVIAAALTAFAAAPAKAAIVLDFDSLNGAANEQPLDYYAGGQGSQGTGVGPNFGISFSDNAVTGLVQGHPGANTDSAAAPSGGNVLFFTSGNSAVMNVAGGFSQGLSFYYTAPFVGGVVNIWSGADATGSLLASLDLPTTGDGFAVAGCLQTDFCPYTPISVTFAGLAGSVDFAGTENQVAFDNIRLENVSAVPEPATWATLIIGFGMLGAFLRRRHRTAISAA